MSCKLCCRDRQPFRAGQPEQEGEIQPAEPTRHQQVEPSSVTRYVWNCFSSRAGIVSDPYWPHLAPQKAGRGAPGS